MKYQLGGELGSDFDTKLACQTEILDQMGKLMSFGPLGGTKLALRRALETPKEAPRGPKRVRGTLIMLRRSRGTSK